MDGPSPRWDYRLELPWTVDSGVAKSLMARKHWEALLRHNLHVRLAATSPCLWPMGAATTSHHREIQNRVLKSEGSTGGRWDYRLELHWTVDSGVAKSFMARKHWEALLRRNPHMRLAMFVAYGSRHYLPIIGKSRIRF